HPVARSEEMMGADIDRHRAQIVQFAQQLFAVAPGGEIGFVIAEPGIDGLIGADLMAQIDGYVDRAVLGPSAAAGQKDSQCPSQALHASLPKNDSVAPIVRHDNLNPWPGKESP